MPWLSCVICNASKYKIHEVIDQYRKCNEALGKTEDEVSTGSPKGSKIKMKRPSEPTITEDGEMFRDDVILDMAKADLVKILKLKNEELLENRVHLHTYSLLKDCGNSRKKRMVPDMRENKTTTSRQTG